MKSPEGHCIKEGKLFHLKNYSDNTKSLFLFIKD